MHIYELLVKSEIGTGLLIAGAVPIKLVVPVIAPVVGIVPKPAVVENLDDLILGVSVKEVQTELLGVLELHAFPPFTT